MSRGENGILLASVFAAALVILGLLPQFPAYSLGRGEVIEALLFTLTTYAVLLIWGYFERRAKSKASGSSIHGEKQDGDPDASE